MRNFIHSIKMLFSRSRIAAMLAVVLVLQLAVTGYGPVGVASAEPEKPVKYITFLYNDFVQANSRLLYNGASTYVNAAGSDYGNLRLTPAVGDRFGTVFNKEKVSLRAGTGFSTYFTFKMTSPGGTQGTPPGADGIVFALQTRSNSAGSLGGGMGFEGITNSVGIEFDTFNNGSAQWGSNGDPSDNHIAVDYNGVVVHGRSGNPAAVHIDGINFNSGSDVHVWIDYNTSEKKLKVFLSTSSNRPGSPSLTQSNLDLLSYLGADEIYAGFTAATGSAWQNHDIKQWYFTNRYDPIDINSATYVEAPSIFSVTTSVYTPPMSVTEVTYTKAAVRLVDSKNNPGPDVDLIVEKEVNVTFLDPEGDFAPLEQSPSLTTDSNGEATYYYMMTNESGAIPSFRISTEYGAYYDLKETYPPIVETGEPVPQYVPDDPTDQKAVIPVQIVNTGGENVIWGVEYREIREDGSTGSWIPYAGTSPKSVLDTSGTYNVTLTGLKEDTYYEVQAYASNTKGDRIGEVKQFAIQMPMPQNGVKYLSAGPSKIYRDDAEYATVVGQNLYWLLKRLPRTDLSVKVIADDTEYAIPRSDLEAATNSLRIKLPKPGGEILPLGKYDISIEHEYFDDRLFEDAIELTDDVAYRSINYESVVVVNEDLDPSEVDKIEIRGPFVVHASEEDLYQTRDANAVFTFNDNLLFKGSQLTVNKETGEISGKGRFYVNGKNAIPVLSTFTIYEGSFSFKPESFSFTLSGGLAGAPTDLTGMNMPVKVESFTFIKGGIRVAGSANLGFKAGSTSISASADMDALEFKKNRFDLAAKFRVGADFKSGPLEAGELRFSIDTRIPSYGAGATAELRKAGIGFEIDLLIVDKKLDSISFAFSKEMKLGSTGAQLTKLGGGVSNMASKTEAPLTFSVLGGMSDYVTPKISNTYMVNGNDLRIDLSANHFGASGKLAIYKINIAGVDLFVVFNPTGYKGYNRAGFDFKATINIIDVIVGSIAASYFQGSSFSGYAKAAVQIPGSVPLVGGKKLTSAEVGVDSSRFKGALSVIGIGFTVKYPFSSGKFDWDVDMSSTIKNVAKAVVNVGKSVVSAVKSWFWYDDPNLAGEWTAAEYGVEGVTGEKLFSASGIRSTAFGSYSPARLAAIISETNPNVEKSGFKFVHSFAADKSYSALIAINGEATDLKLTGPNGADTPILFEASDASKINAYYDAHSDKTIVSVNLTPGTWKLTSGSSLTLTVHEALFWNPTLSLAQAAEQLNASDVQSMIPIHFAKRGKYLVEINEASADAILLKSDGRPYATEANAASEAYNSQWVAADGKLFLLVEVPQAGTWYAIAGADAQANLYRMADSVTMSEALEWIEGSEFVTVANFKAVPGAQVMLEIQGASEATRLYRPDGTEYPFVTDSSDDDWNAVYSASQAVIRALVDVDQEGYWLLKSDGFVDSDGFTLSPKMTMEEMTDSDATITYSLRVNEKGKYLYDIAGGDASTKVYGVNGQLIPLVLYDEDAVTPTPNANAIQDDQGLMVTIDVPAAGTVQIQTKLGASVKQYLLAPIPEVTKLTATGQVQRNTYEVAWKVENAKADTKASLILTNGDKDETGSLIPVGDTIASDLPATGITTVTLPNGYLPGDYYLALAADSESYGTIYKTLTTPLSYQALVKQPKPTGVQASAIGNGEVKVSFTDPGYEETTSYRIYPADAAGNVDFNGTSYEGEVVQANGVNQVVTLSGLETGLDYSFRVMAIRAQYASVQDVIEETLVNVYVSDLSDPASVYLPVPNPAKLNVSYATGDAPTYTSTYYPYNVTEAQLAGLSAEEKEALAQKLAVTSSNNVTLQVDSDQSVTLKLLVDDVEVPAVNGTPNTFNLGELGEKDYIIELQAVNAAGDISYSHGRLFIDRTAPYLFLKNVKNGSIVEDDRVLLEGVSEAGVKLTINGAVVPVDAMGHYSYYATIPATGVLPIEMIAVDQAGNETVHRLEVFSAGDGGADQTDSDLAALGADDGMLTSAFKPADLNYELALDVRTKSIRVTAAPVDPTATVTIAGTTADANYSALVELKNGRTIPITVKGTNSAAKTYVIEVKGQSDLASLSGLEITQVLNEDPQPDSEPGLELSRAFKATEYEYEATADPNAASVKVTPTAIAEGSLIQVNGTLVASGETSAPIALSVNQAIIVKVLSPNDASAASPDWSKAQTYTIDVERPAIIVPGLSDLQLTGATMSPAEFDSDVLEYSARVGASTNSVLLSYTAADAGAVVTLGGEVLSGSKSLNDLAFGANRYTLHVKSADDSERTYSIVIYKDKDFSNALLLNNLSVDNYELTREFTPLVRNYNVKGRTLSSSIKVNAEAAVEGSIVRVNGQELKDGSAMAYLNVGANSILVQVESPDKSETNTYSIGIERGTIIIPTDSFEVKVNSDVNDKIATGKKTEVNGQTVLKVNFLNEETRKLLDSEGDNPVITINAGFSPDRMTTELTADLVQAMQKKNAIVLIEAGDSYYILPTSSLNLSQINDTFAPDSLEQVTVRLDIRLLDKDEAQAIDRQARAAGATLLGGAYDFDINYTYNGRTISADRFTQYVERAIALPDGMDNSQVTTGVRYNEDGTLDHVPTYVQQVEGRYYAVMNSFTNSVYALIHNQATFNDVADRWSQGAIENLASRKILTGLGDGTFAPTRNVTRGEFAAMIVRALGLPAQADSGFSDVKTNDWYAPYVASAKVYGLINGYTNGTFRPMQTITRAEAVSMINKAWVLAGKKAISETDSALTLERIADQSKIPAWAREAIGSALELGLLSGYTDGSVKPLRMVSREEVAAMLQNLLIRADLIQP